MTTTITSKGQITIPMHLRQKFNLRPGDQLEFDDSAPVLTARRVVNRGEWEEVMDEWQTAAEIALNDHPWADQSSTAVLEELREGASEEAPSGRGE